MYSKIGILRFQFGAASGVFSNLRSVYLIGVSLNCQRLTSFIPHFGVSILCLKCNKNVFIEEYVLEENVNGVKQFGHSGCGESNNEHTCCVEDRDLN